MKRWPWTAVVLLLLAPASCTSSVDDPVGGRSGSSASASPGTTAVPRPGPSSGASPVGTGIGPHVYLRVGDPRIGEDSGVARSPGHAGVLYLHNDKASNEVYAVDPTGTRAVLRLDVTSVDWEDIASTPDGRIWVGDIGDNTAVRPEIAVLVFTEPEVLTSATLPATSYRLRYPDGPHNAETLLVDPTTDQVYVVTKQAGGAMVYAAPARLSANRVNVLRPVQAAPDTISGGAFAPDGDGFVLRTYGRAFFYSGWGTEPVVRQLPRQQQGEGITFDADGAHVLLTSEGAGSPVLRVRAP